MKVLLVNGSPHEEGSTYTALSEVTKTFNKEGIDTEIFWIGAKQDGEGMYTMRVLGRNMAYMLKCREAAAKAGVALPEREEPVFTNFIR